VLEADEGVEAFNAIERPNLEIQDFSCQHIWFWCKLSELFDKSERWERLDRDERKQK
jgi:hypothetical protein